MVPKHRPWRLLARAGRLLLPALLLGWSLGLRSAILPADRADALYHAYDGGGVQVNGPSILVRKSIGTSVSASYNYYVDNVSSASVDVLSYASPYTEQRTEQSVNVDYLHGKSTMNLSYTNSDESDYVSDTYSFTLSQDLFGDLTTVALGYSVSDNTVGRNNRKTGTTQIVGTARVQGWRLNVSQILSKNSLLGFTFDTISDEGYLNNPYRSVRYLDSGSGTGFSYQTEVYPNTRTSNAGALRLRYYLPWRAAVSAGYRLFSDTWGIRARTWELGYTQTWRDRWTFEARYRLYDQTKADFYSDLFPYRDAQNFLARDKELSTYTSRNLGLGVTYHFLKNGWGFIDDGTANLFYDMINFDYQDFRNIPAGGLAGQEPLYSFDAGVIRAFLSIWY